MAVTQGFTIDEVREFVHQHELQPHGSRAAWLAAAPFTRHQLYRWRKMVFEGDLDRGLLPREYGGMTRSPSEWSAFERRRAKEIAEHQAEVDKLTARVRELEGTNDALGKAIGLLHELNVSEPDAKTTNGPESSFRRRTNSSEN
jgi:hypothetical protein